MAEASSSQVYRGFSLTSQPTKYHVIMPVSVLQAWALNGQPEWYIIQQSQKQDPLGIIRFQCLNYRYESVFRRDKLSESAVYTVSTRVTSGPYAQLKLLVVLQDGALVTVAKCR